MADGNTDAVNLKKLFEESFPEFQCRRCGFDEFLILGPIKESLNKVGKKIIEESHRNQSVFQRELIDIDQFAEGAWRNLFVEVCCNRCGSTEQFFLPMLMSATKPIPWGKS